MGLEALATPALPLPLFVPLAWAEIEGVGPGLGDVTAARGTGEPEATGLTTRPSALDAAVGTTGAAPAAAEPSVNVAAKRVSSAPDAALWRKDVARAAVALDAPPPLPPPPPRPVVVT